MLEKHLCFHALWVGKRSVPVIIIVRKRGNDVFGVLGNVSMEFAFSALQELGTCSSVAVGVALV